MCALKTYVGFSTISGVKQVLVAWNAPSHTAGGSLVRCLRAGDIDHLVGYPPIIQEIWFPSPALRKMVTVPSVYNPRTREVEVEGSKVLSYMASLRSPWATLRGRRVGGGRGGGKGEPAIETIGIH